MKNFEFKKNTIVELNTDGMRAVDSGAHTTTTITPATPYIVVYTIITNTTFTSVL